MKSELAITDQIEVKRSVAVLIERESENLVLARGSKDFGIKIVDPVPSETPSYPNLRVWAAMGAVFGLFSGIIFGVCALQVESTSETSVAGVFVAKIVDRHRTTTQAVNVSDVRLVLERCCLVLSETLGA